MSLVSPEEYASLPIELGARFVAFEEICRRGMYASIDPDTNPEQDQMVRLEYMAEVSAAAKACGVDGLKFPWGHDNPIQAFQAFILTATSIATELRMQSFGQADPLTVRLASKTRGKIEQQIAKLRDIITGSDLSERQRNRLMDKLNELSVELSQPRVQYGKFMAALALVCATLGGTTSFLAEAPSAVATITRLLGEDKMAEEAEAERLGPPPAPKALPPKPRALPPPNFGQRQTDFGQRGRELDDEIPF
ncbi:MAG: hypothetical protein EOS63_04935 [Mesorhizobium sp.]|uniref:hypothetical protein n=1 Tax=Mesorhizobium sp. TaxID=1871066 RepID=UPI000FE69592|nr:hypothetical protein [Mesorhizobium sp.]RWE83472.1 MAG: hypothetical protein EOS63_04935 [Mesorhizobium sp.]TJW61348.1 MAG: hypothetical protein E5V97_20845 [Mesorhizobium sp.]